MRPDMDNRIAATLRSTFGYDSFRPLQEEIVRAILGGRDVFVLMPTGGGKSLCYQLPALLLDGLAVVVSPLISLMKDQVDKLQAMGVAATFINSSLDPAEIGRRQGAVARGDVKLLYVAPERLMLPGFLQLLAAAEVAFFAIDEAHCISEWGHDFRPEYRELRRLRERFPATPLAAFTATATRRVQADIVAQLEMEQALTFRGSFNRPNLYYEVLPKHAAYEHLAGYLRGHPDPSGIVYCQSRAGTEALAARLAADGFSATAYHAGLEGDERRRRQEAFSRDDVRIVVATIAFGMGIDKPDVRFVVHFDLPKNLEGYYQESGRAGRDGEPSDCLLFYSYGDAAKHEHFIRQKPSAAERQVAGQQLRQMVGWAESATCRRRALLAYFDESLDGADGGRRTADDGLAVVGRQSSAVAAGAAPGRCCDVCLVPAEEVDATIPAQMLLSCVVKTRQRFGVAHLIEVLRGSRGERVLRNGHDQVSTYGIGRDRPKEEWQHLARELLRGGYMHQDPDDFNAVKVTERGRAVLFRGDPVAIRAAPARPAPPAAPAAQPGQDLVSHPALFDRLRAVRKRLADERGVPPYVIFHDATLRHMAAALPTSADALRRIQGVGERKLHDFAGDFLPAIEAYVRETGAQPLAAPPPPASAPPPPRRVDGKLPPTVQATLDLFRAGHGVAAIAAQRNLAAVTVENHLADAVAAGAPLDLDRVVGRDKQRAIAAALAELGAARLSPIMERLGPGYTYLELKLVRAALAQAGAPPAGP
jgi:ATP-dependent DNA helicase RecQ